MVEWQKRIQGILDDHVKRGVVGVSLAISRPGGEITHFTSGLSEKFKKPPMRRDHLFRIASCTKTFIATGLHLLVRGRQGRPRRADRPMVSGNSQGR